jgi:hypothetical protein
MLHQGVPVQCLDRSASAFIDPDVLTSVNPSPGPLLVGGGVLGPLGVAKTSIAVWVWFYTKLNVFVLFFLSSF